MKKSIATQLSSMVAVVSFVLLFASCTKDSSLPAQVSDPSAIVGEQTSIANELAEKKPSAGVYKITKFIDSGDDETAQFQGYKFEFRSGGIFIATTKAGKVFNGTWALNSAQTKMEINIAGNDALKDIDDDDWKIDAITSKRIRISAPGPDSVSFVKI